MLVHEIFESGDLKNDEKSKKKCFEKIELSDDF